MGIIKFIHYFSSLLWTENTEKDIGNTTHTLFGEVRGELKVNVWTENCQELHKRNKEKLAVFCGSGSEQPPILYLNWAVKFKIYSDFALFPSV